MAQRKWEKPQLIVLVRGKPEEFVLANCKTQTITGSSSSLHWYDKCSGDYNVSCMSGATGQSYCYTGTGGGGVGSCPYQLCSALGTS